MNSVARALEANAIITKILKLRFPNLTVEETNEIARNIIIGLGDVMS